MNSNNYCRIYYNKYDTSFSEFGDLERICFYAVKEKKGRSGMTKRKSSKDLLNIRNVDFNDKAQINGHIDAMLGRARRLARTTSNHPVTHRAFKETPYNKMKI